MLSIHHRGAACARVLVLALALAVAGSAGATEEEFSVAEISADSISQVMLEELGLELEDATWQPEAAEVVETQTVPAAEPPPPVPARAAPSP